VILGAERRGAKSAVWRAAKALADYSAEIVIGVRTFEREVVGYDILMSTSAPRALRKFSNCSIES